MQPIKSHVFRLCAHVAALLPDRHIIFQSEARARHLRLTSGVQWVSLALLAAMLIGAVPIAWGERAAISAKSKALTKATGETERHRKSVEARTRELEARQDFIDDLYRAHFGEGESSSKGALNSPADKASGRQTGHALDVLYSSNPNAMSLQMIDARQRRFASLLAHAATRQADRTAHAIRSLGLNPQSLSRAAAGAQGGPFVPWPSAQSGLPEEFSRLADAVSRMEALEAGLKTIPSGRPTMAPMQSSSYGYRRDPFNNQAAFHAGMDFPGRHGEPILAAAAGKVSFAGQRTGYGNVVEVTHGNGLMTRYAHLSGFDTRVGKQVARGEQIARMGSTGRSTGDHLHFEVRVKGEPVNPRPFLEAPRDVREVQNSAVARAADIRNRG